MSDLDQLGQRVEQLEGVVRALYAVVRQLRAEMATLRGAPTAQATSERSTTGTVPTRPLGAMDAPGATAAGSAMRQAVPSGAAAPASAAPASAAQVSATAVGPTIAVPAAAGPGVGVPRSAEAARPGATQRDISLEAVVGRYGALGLATVSILLGVGAFVQWAIARGLLGPPVRVALGFVAAVGIAAVGMWLRGRGARAFGHTLLALALAVVHVDAWGAGPILHLVSSPVALAVAAVASAVLAWLALVDGEPAIFSVGVGGALLAPFVTSSGQGARSIDIAWIRPCGHRMRRRAGHAGGVRHAAWTRRCGGPYVDGGGGLAALAAG